ncbi:hypothetical protein BGW36DRAFT_403960 [Talaromyces proteolyticus]|uniref:NAD(P)-binding domain-containing protein n=1 Tax=Talaromyces proteolyticus TaxID=1131652 RepID=A0AAD4L3M5_9EURO|nr:uncharacterized protein BGW36DRAFT_403960 [Talaromyces proteolyticus]KAH8703603.1 hypothetical protein BGW36DRAFT_403960 [Talaromyces proteolyticus]
MHNNLPTLAFFGATGGCVIACLKLALENGYHCNALARNPNKLKDLLTERGVYDSAIANNLSITEGSVTEIDLVRQALLYNDVPVDIIICGIGGKLIFESALKPTLDNPTVCQDAMRNILQAARSLKRDENSKDNEKPLLAVLSTTGISQKRDLPILMMPMYKWMLKVPHEDKKVMEDLILEDMAMEKSQRGIGDYIIVRPSFLTDGDGDGLGKIKVGPEEKPRVGYVIARNDVGAWLFENSVRRGWREDNPYRGKVVTITT